MQNSVPVVGTVLMVLGVALVLTAVFRTMNHQWGLGFHELWALPTAGAGLILLGRWLVP